jgi:hypothetical protein
VSSWLSHIEKNEIKMKSIDEMITRPVKFNSEKGHFKEHSYVIFSEAYKTAAAVTGLRTLRLFVVCAKQAKFNQISS